MSLNRNESEPSETTKTAMDKSFHQMAEQMEELGLLAKDRESAARQNKELYMLLMTMAKFGQIQEDFLKNTAAVLNEQNKHQMKLLNVQDEYVKSVQSSTAKAITDIYYTFRTEQEKAFQEIRHYLVNDTEEMIKKINHAAVGAKKAADYANSTANRIKGIEDWKELLFYLSPAVVVLDVIVRLIISFSG